MNIQIKHRFTAAVLFQTEVADDDTRPVRTALLAAIRSGRDAAALRTELGEINAQMDDHDEWDDLSEDEQNHKRALRGVIERELATPGSRANLAGANLAGAYLAGAYLAGAYLADACLAGANLAGAYLAGAYLARADLADAYLADAYLADACLAGAYLAGANLARANLARADLARANLARARNKPASLANHVDPSEPYVREAAPSDGETASTWASRRRERLAKRAADYRAAHPEIPVVEQLDARILEHISKPGNVLDMSQWHGGEDHHNGTACGTTHCRAGWAVMLAGAPGLALEAKLGSAERAGREIYLASTGRVPHFFGTDEQALADIRRCAAEQTERAAEPTDA